MSKGCIGSRDVSGIGDSTTRTVIATEEPCPVHYWATVAPARTAIHTLQGPLSYRALDRRCSSLGRQLLACGLQPGDRLAACVRGALEDVLLAWACLRSGIILCPLNPAFPVTQLAQLATQLQVHAVWSPSGIPAGPWLAVDFDFAAESSDYVADDVAVPPLLIPDRLNNIILTSGSSSTPKAVVHTLGNHLASARGAAICIPLDSDCGWLLSLPLHHVGGYAIPVRVFLAGAALVLDDRHTLLTKRLEQQPITHLSLVPTQLWRLLSAGFDPTHTRLRAVLLGGAAIPATLVARLTALGITPHVSYGLSEMSSQVCTGHPAESGAVGKPLPGREAKVIEGEICVRGSTLFAGYFKGGTVQNPCDANGWFHTRDKGHFNPAGELVVEGRLDNLFISGGENIQPETIERRLEEHPAVAQALIVPLPCEEWGQRPVAFVDWLRQPVPNSELEAWLRATLPGFMVPTAWLSWPTGEDNLKPSRARLIAGLISNRSAQLELS
jgi:O-succinylbenzoic acid--CoA ligase